MQDTVKDHIYELQVTGLDDLKDQLDENYEDYVNELSSNLAKMSEAINNCVTTVGSNTTQVLTAMNQILAQYGLNTTTYGIAGQFASGTTSVKKSGLYQVNEQGREMIITKSGKVLVPLQTGDGVIPNNLTEKLIAMAQGNYPTLKGMDLNVTPVNMSNEINANIAPVVDCTVTINGNADGKDVANAIKSELPNITKQVSTAIYKDLRKIGY